MNVPLMHGTIRESCGSRGGPPRHAAWKPPVADLLPGGRLRRLPDATGRMVRLLWRGVVGLLPDAQPCASDRRARERGRLASGSGRGAPAVHAADQLSRRLAVPPVAGTVRLVRDGRALPAAGGPLRGTQSGAGEIVPRALAVALVQCGGPCGRSGRRCGVRVAPAGASEGWRLLIPCWEIAGEHIIGTGRGLRWRTGRFALTFSRRYGTIFRCMEWG